MKIGINGFGRIGRLVLRAILENYKDKIKNARNFLNELGNPYEIIISDLDGTLSIEWGAYGVPESYLIYNQKILKKVVGPISLNNFFEIKDLVK